MPYASAVVERTMKVQAVLMQAISGKLTWLQAEEILGWRPRTLRRWRLRYQRRGYDGLWDRRRQQPSPRRAPVAEVARIVHRYRERYTGFNAAHFHEIAQREHQVPYAYTFVKRLLQAAQLLPKRRPRGRPRRRREPRPCFGEMLHLDGSPHVWLALRPTERQTLLQSIDDATKRVLYAQLVPAESTATVMAALWHLLETHGLPQALYTDRAGWAFYTPKAGEPVDRDRLTQVGRALARLGIEHIPAYSPQARGRSERLNRTFQDRLVNELRVAGISTVPAAHRDLTERFLAASDARFAHPPADPAAAFVPLGSTSPTSSVTKTHAPWVRTTPSPSRASGCRSTSSRGAAPAPGCASSGAAISMASTGSGTAPAASAITMPGAGASRRPPRPARAACSRLCPPSLTPCPRRDRRSCARYGPASPTLAPRNRAAAPSRRPDPSP